MINTVRSNDKRHNNKNNNNNNNVCDIDSSFSWLYVQNSSIKIFYGKNVKKCSLGFLLTQFGLPEFI